MRPLRLVVLFALLALLAFGALTAEAAPVRIQANLSGAAEVPGPGDPDGTGYALFTVDPANGSVCYRLYASAIAPATAAHIHRGAVGVAGPVVVPLQPPTNGASFACAQVSLVLASEIATYPSRFYVNVHNAQYPAGAIRGQLRSSP